MLRPRSSRDGAEDCVNGGEGKKKKNGSKIKARKKITYAGSNWEKKAEFAWEVQGGGRAGGDVGEGEKHTPQEGRAQGWLMSMKSRRYHEKQRDTAAKGRGGV